MNAALCDYKHSAFINYLKLVDVALSSFFAFSKETDPSDPANEINSTIFHVSNIRMLSNKFIPELLQYIDEEIRNWGGLEKYFEEILPLAESTWENKEISELWSALEEQLSDEPFSDVGSMRKISFSALGVRWKFECRNAYLENCLMEEFISSFQIILADLADTDLCLLRTNIEIEIIISDELEFNLEPIPSNERNRFKLFISQNQKDLEINLIGYAFEIIYYTSLLPKDKLFKRLEIALREDLPAKTFFGRRYNKLYKYFISKEDFNDPKRSLIVHPKYQTSFSSKLKTKLEWFNKPGPIFSEFNLKEALINRYKRSIPPIKYTLKRLAKDPKFLDTIKILRDDSWLDWHILNSISMQAINYRIKKFKESGIILPMSSVDSLKENGILFNTFCNREEEKDSAQIPLSEFSEKKLRTALNISMSSTLQILGLELHQLTPDFNAISDFLGIRYNYWKDDIEHENIGF